MEVSDEEVEAVAVAVATVAVVQQELYPRPAAAAAEVAAIVPVPVFVPVYEIDLCIQCLVLMAEIAAKVAAEPEEEIEGVQVLERLHTEGVIVSEVDMVV